MSSVPRAVATAVSSRISLAAAATAADASGPALASIGAEASVARRTAATTACSSAPRIVGNIAMPFGADCNWSALYLRTSLLLSLGRVHAIALGKVLTDSVSTHRCVFDGQSLRLMSRVTLILAIIDASHT